LLGWRLIGSAWPNTETGDHVCSRDARGQYRKQVFRFAAWGSDASIYEIKLEDVEFEQMFTMLRRKMVKPMLFWRIMGWLLLLIGTYLTFDSVWEGWHLEKIFRPMLGGLARSALFATSLFAALLLACLAIILALLAVRPPMAFPYALVFVATIVGFYFFLTYFHEELFSHVG